MLVDNVKWKLSFFWLLFCSKLKTRALKFYWQKVCMSIYLGECRLVTWSDVSWKTILTILSVFFPPASVNSWWRYEHDIVKSCECFNQSFHTFEWSSDRRFTVVEVSSVSFGYTLQQVARTEIDGLDCQICTYGDKIWWLALSLHPCWSITYLQMMLFTSNSCAQVMTSSESRVLR